MDVPSLPPAGGSGDDLQALADGADSRSLVFLFDENSSPRLASALQEVGESVTHVNQAGLRGSPDELVLRHAGERGWFVISRDHRILRRPWERRVLTDFNMGAFFLNENLRSMCEMVQAVVRNWPEIKRIARTQKRPFIYSINQTSVKAIRRSRPD